LARLLVVFDTQLNTFAGKKKTRRFNSLPGKCCETVPPKVTSSFNPNADDEAIVNNAMKIAGQCLHKTGMDAE
jgi:hypothetical protein